VANAIESQTTEHQAARALMGASMNRLIPDLGLAAFDVKKIYVPCRQTSLNFEMME
jgi:hypothetical protein